MAEPKPRIARIITRLNIGGPSIQAIDLTRSLAGPDFETCLIHGHLADGEGDMTKLMPVGDATMEYVDSLVRPISPVHDLRALWRIYGMLRRWRPDIVHTHQAKAGSLGRLAALLCNLTRRTGRIRLVHTYHGHVFEGYFGSPSTRLFLWVERWLGKRTDALIAISPQVRLDLIDTYRIANNQQLHVIPLGFNLDRFLAITPGARRSAKAALGIGPDTVAIATVGRLTAIKQHSLFLEMAGLLSVRADRFTFLVVGDGELRAELEAQATALGLGSRLRFLGWRGDLDNIYAATDIFVLTSRNEGTPVALIEAMASGVASVSTDVGGVKDVMTGPDLGSLVRFGDPAALAEEVSRLAEAPDRRAAIGEAGRASVRERFHATRLLHDIRKLYWQLLDNGGTISGHRRT